MSPTSQEVCKLTEGEGVRVNPLGASLRVLLTSRRIEGVPDTAVFRDNRINIISDHFETMASTATCLWLARRVLQLGIGATLGRTCDRCVCVAGSDPDYSALCDDCEKILRSQSYRDGVRHLKDTINWLNQHRDDTDPLIETAPRAEIPANLRLAHEYAAADLAGTTFSGKTVLMVLHFLSDLVPFVEALHKAGAEYKDMVLIAKPYPYSHRDAVSHHLECLGVDVHRAGAKEVSELATDVLNKLVSARDLEQRSIVVIEDGGYFAPLLHEDRFAAIARRCVGVVEQTTKGIREAEDRIPKERFKLPILSVAKSNFKDDYESPEVGRITVQNIGRFVPNVKLSGGHAIVFGFGSIGEHVAANLNRAFNMAVSVAVTDEAHLLKAIHRKDIVMEAKKDFDQLRFRDLAVLVVGTTGRKHTISEAVITNVRDGCILASTSSDRVEIDMPALERLAGRNIEPVEEGNVRYTIKVGEQTKTITVLADGYPINFYASESLPNDTIDPVMTLLLLSAAELCNNVVEPGIQLELVNEVTKNHKLIERVLKTLNP